MIQIAKIRFNLDHQKPAKIVGTNQMALKIGRNKIPLNYIFREISEEVFSTNQYEFVDLILYT
jgi:hypothetical protein